MICGASERLKFLSLDPERLSAHVNLAASLAYLTITFTPECLTQANGPRNISPV